MNIVQDTTLRDIKKDSRHALRVGSQSISVPSCCVKGFPECGLLYSHFLGPFLAIIAPSSFA